MRAWIALIAVVVAAPACLIDVTYPPGLQCDDGECPGDQVCVEQVCVQPTTADAGATPDAAGPDASTQPACGGSLAFYDDFSDGLGDWWVDGAPAQNVAFQDRLVVAVPDGVAGESSGAFSGPRFDLTESQWFARVSPSPAGTTEFGIQGIGGMAIRFVLDGNTLEVGTADDNVDVAYSQAEHVFWGLREVGGVIQLETSTDGVDFTAHHSVPTPVYASAFQMRIVVSRVVGTELIESSFDDFNGGTATGVPWCESSSRTDDFEDGMIASHWSLFGTGCGMAAESGGELVLPALGGSCVLSTNGLFELSGSSFEIELGTPIPTGFFSWSVLGNWGRYVLTSNVGELAALDCPPEGVCTPVSNTPFVDQRFWRFRGEGDVVVLSVSSDGAMFTDIATFPAADIGATRVSLNVADGQTVRVRQFN